MKSAHEQVSSRPNSFASLKNAPQILPVRGSLLALVGRKQTVVKDQLLFSLRNLPVCAFDCCAQGFSIPLARRTSSCPPTSPNLVPTHLMERYRALRDSVPCVSRAATFRREPKWSSEKARTWEHHPRLTIIPPPRLSRPAESRRQSVGCISQG